MRSALFPSLQPGYYLVKPASSRFPKVSFCDMSLRPNDPGFERIFGSPGNLRHFAAFDASIESV